MKLILLFALLISFLFKSNAQIANSATAVMHFDSSLVESISGILPTPWSPSSYTFVEDRLGNAHGAVKLQAQLDYGNPNFSRMDSSDFSIAFWFRKDGSLWQEKPVLQKKALLFNTPNQGDVFYEEYGLFYNDWIGTGSMQLRFKPHNDSNGVGGALGFIPESVWHHIAITFDRSDSMKSYVNGQLYQSKYIGLLEQHQANIDSAVLMVGNGNISLDEVNFFKQVLTDAEVLELYNMTSTASLDKLVEQEKLLISPNPNNGYFIAQIPHLEAENAVITVHDLKGQVMPFKSNVITKGEISINVSELPKGVYLLSVQNQEGIYTQKISLK